MRSETSIGSREDESERKKGNWKEKLQGKVGRKVIHTGAVWMPRSEEAETRFRSMFLQF